MVEHKDFRQQQHVIGGPCRDSENAGHRTGGVLGEDTAQCGIREMLNGLYIYFIQTRSNEALMMLFPSV